VEEKGGKEVEMWEGRRRRRRRGRGVVQQQVVFIFDLTLVTSVHIKYNYVDTKVSKSLQKKL